jgi:hypothetical protein
MRYVISMAAAITFALVATLFISMPLANFAVDRYTFESPDEVAQLHTLVFMLSNLSALLIGWIVGWFAAGRLLKKVSA